MFICGWRYVISYVFFHGHAILHVSNCIFLKIDKEKKYIKELYIVTINCNLIVTANKCSYKMKLEYLFNQYLKKKMQTHTSKNVT